MVSAQLFLIFLGADTSIFSSRVFHSPHCGHLPIHFSVSAPQFEHLYLMFLLFFPLMLNTSYKKMDTGNAACIHYTIRLYN